MTIPSSLRDPDVMHGMLIYAELGRDLGVAAKRLSVSLVDLGTAMDDAHAGKVPKAPFVNGSPLKVSEADAPPPAHNPLRASTEMFPRDWQRQIILSMMLDGGIGTKDIRTILERNMLVSTVGDRMGTLRISLQKAGMDFQTIDTNKATVRYQIVGDHKVKMLALMKNGWVAQ